MLALNQLGAPWCGLKPGGPTSPEIELVRGGSPTRSLGEKRNNFPMNLDCLDQLETVKHTGAPGIGAGTLAKRCAVPFSQALDLHSPVRGDTFAKLAPVSS